MVPMSNAALASAQSAFPVGATVTVTPHEGTLAAGATGVVLGYDRHGGVVVDFTAAPVAFGDSTFTRLTFDQDELA